MADQFKLPGSSFEEVKKIIAGYANLDKPSSRIDVSRATGVTKDAVSRSSGFLVSIGVIGSGAKKAPTEIGKRLGRALSYGAEDAAVQVLSEIVSETEFLKNIVGAVRIRKGMDENALRSHIAYSAGAKKHAHTAAGAGCVIDLLKLSGYLKEEDGKIVVGAVSSANSSTSSNDAIKEHGPENNILDAPIQPSSDDSRVSLPLSPSPFNISVNVEVTCSADDLDTLGERLRKVVDDFQRGVEEENTEHKNSAE